MSPDAYEQALSESLNNSAPNILKFPVGAPYSPLATTTARNQEAHTSNATQEEIEADDEPATPSSESQEKRPAAHIEKEEFTGDRVLANSILFKMEYSWWIEAAYAIPDGDIGRVWEIMKVNSLAFDFRAFLTNGIHLDMDIHCCWCWEHQLYEFTS